MEQFTIPEVDTSDQIRLPLTPEAKKHAEESYLNALSAVLEGQKPPLDLVTAGSFDKSEPVRLSVSPREIDELKGMFGFPDVENSHILQPKARVLAAYMFVDSQKRRYRPIDQRKQMVGRIEDDLTNEISQTIRSLRYGYDFEEKQFKVAQLKSREEMEEPLAYAFEKGLNAIIAADEGENRSELTDFINQEFQSSQGRMRLIGDAIAVMAVRLNYLEGQREAVRAIGQVSNRQQ